MKRKIDGHSILLPCLFILAVVPVRLAAGAAWGNDAMMWSGPGACLVAAMGSLLIFAFDGSRAALVQAEWTEAACRECRRMTER